MNFSNYYIFLFLVFFPNSSESISTQLIKQKIRENFAYDKMNESLKINNERLEIINPLIVLTLSSAINYKQFIEIKNSEDMPKEIVDWCKSIFLKNNITVPENINYKIKKDKKGAIHNFWAVFGHTYIIIDEWFANSLIDAIKNPENSEEFLYISEFFLLHELYHLISYHNWEIGLFRLLSIIFNNQLVNYFINPQLSKYRNDLKSFLKNYSIFLGGSFLKNKLIESMNISFMRDAEYKADQFSISKINNIDQLNSVIKFFEKTHKNLLYIIENPEKIINEANINIFIRSKFSITYNSALIVYRLSESKESFTSWIEKNPFWLERIHKSYDPSHPMSLDRIKIIEKRKQELETNNL